LKDNRLIGLVGIAAIALALLACDAGNLVAMINPPTQTPSRTPRPTFTPRPAATDTPESTPTPDVTDTPLVSPTSTKRAVATARPATPKPVATAPPPPPQFPVTFVEGYLCPQPNDPIWKITGRINKTGSNFFLGGYTLGLFASDGKFLKASQPSAENDYITSTIGGNCRAEKVFLSNLDFDVSEFRMQVPLVVRIIRSATDHTALSADHTINFEQPGNYYVQYHAAQ
jgi:hypothetical protein